MREQVKNRKRIVHKKKAERYDDEAASKVKNGNELEL